MRKEDLGLWGTADQNRVGVSLSKETPDRIVGYVCLTGGGDWSIEGDEENRRFATPYEAARAGINDWIATTVDSDSTRDFNR